jgi:hypothetical protein
MAFFKGLDRVGCESRLLVAGKIAPQIEPLRIFVIRLANFGEPLRAAQ